MKTNDFINKNFDIAFGIHKATDKLGYSVDHARLFTYIYFKLDSNNNDFKYFEKKNQLELDVIQFLMNDKKLEFGPKTEKYFKSLKNLPNTLNNLDYTFRQDLGMEIRIKSELMNRYRLHTDQNYRKKMMSIYKNEVLPQLKDIKKAA